MDDFVETPSPSTARKTKVDWKAIEKRWNAGDQPVQICYDYSIPESTLFSRKRRHGWKDRPQKSVAEATEKQVQSQVKAVVANEIKAIGPEIPSMIRAQLNAHFQAVLGTVKRLHSKLDCAAEKRIDVEEIRSLSSSLEVIDKVARRTFGLDSPDSRNLGALVSCTTSVECPVIEAEVVGEATIQPVTPTQ